MVIKSEQAGSGRSDKFEDVFVNDKAQNIQNEIEILKSRPLMQRVIDSLHLQFNYYAIGKIKTVNIYKQSPFFIHAINITDSFNTFSVKIKLLNDHEFRINSDKQTYSYGQTFKNAKGSFSLKRNPVYPAVGDYSVVWLPASSGARIYAGDLQIIPKTPGTGILNISMMTDNSQMGADIVNKLMDEYAIYTIEQKKESSDKILSFIDERLDVTGHELDSVRKVLVGFKERNKLIDAEIQTGNYLGNISESDKFINTQILEQNKADLVNVYLRDKRNQFNKVPTSLSLQDGTLNQLINEYNKAQIERQQFLDANIPVDNPAVRETEGQIEKLRVNMLEAIKNINASITSTIGDTRKNSVANQAELQKIPGKVKEKMEIEQHELSLQNLYKYLQEKREETAITRASTISNSNIIDMAYSTDTPVAPNRKAIQILAILLGLGLPALLIFVSEILNDKVSTRFDIEKLTTAPILGEIGHSFSNKVLVVSKTTRSMVAEQFRIIRSNLQYILHKAERSTILVTSSFSGEGKSYVTTNMGAVLALAGKKTIILEFDIRKPKILSGLEILKGPGITNFLVGKANLPDLIKPVPEQENLFVLGCGPVPPNPSELLLDPKMDEMFAWLKANFDVILVDTAPVGMVSDAMTLSKFADSTLYLVRQGHTFKKQIALIDEFYIGNKLPKISIVINDVKIKPGYGYYGYGRYGYGYGYGYGSYYDEEKPPMGFVERLLHRFGSKKNFTKKK
jgi:capsular exopolysaccharide synthesis family protein